MNRARRRTTPVMTEHSTANAGKRIDALMCSLGIAWQGGVVNPQ
jgi:hypothetical protein